MGAESLHVQLTISWLPSKADGLDPVHPVTTGTQVHTIPDPSALESEGDAASPEKPSEPKDFAGRKIFRPYGGNDRRLPWNWVSIPGPSSR